MYLSATRHFKMADPSSTDSSSTQQNNVVKEFIAFLKHFHSFDARALHQYKDPKLTQKGYENQVGVHELFKSDSGRILIEGNHGTGKTLLCHKLACSWAEGKSLQEFEMVFLFSCQDIRSGNIWNAVEEQLLVKHYSGNEYMKKHSENIHQKQDTYDIEKQEIFDYIKTNQDKVIFIIDDFNECSAIVESGKKTLPWSYFIVTSKKAFAEDLFSCFELSEVKVFETTSDTRFEELDLKYTQMKKFRFFMDDKLQHDTTFLGASCFLIIAFPFLKKTSSPQILKALKSHHSSVIDTPLKFNVNLEVITGGHMLDTNNCFGYFIGFDSAEEMDTVLQQSGAINVQAKLKCRDRDVKVINLLDILKITARRLCRQRQSDISIHSIIPYSLEDEIAVVIYTYNITPQLCSIAWPNKFFFYPVFIVDLLSGYATVPPIIPDPYPVIPQEAYRKYEGLNTSKLTMNHSNISTICLDVRTRKNGIHEKEACLQVGVLTKGIIPLGEDYIPKEVDGFPVDVVESSVSWCVSSLPMVRREVPVRLGVGIGIEGTSDCTGTLGAVVKNVGTGDLCLLTCGHVWLGSQVGEVIQPSMQDYNELLAETESARAMYQESKETLEHQIEERTSVGGNVNNLRQQLRKTERNLNKVTEELNNIVFEESPRTIGTVVRTIQERNWYATNGRRYGLDAGIAKIEHLREELSREDYNRMYDWPNDLRNERGSLIDEVKLNGNHLTPEEICEALGNNSLVFKCGRSSGVTKGRLCKEMNVKMPGIPGSGYVPVQEEPSTGKPGNDIWYNVLHIRSTTEGRTGKKSFSVPGDSGAVVFGGYGTCVGLMFGRIDLQYDPLGGGLATPMHVVCHALGVTLASEDDLLM